MSSPPGPPQSASNPYGFGEKTVLAPPMRAGNSRGQKRKLNGGIRVFIGNIPFEVTHADIEEICKDACPQKFVEFRFVMGQDGRHRGQGFLEMSDIEGAAVAITLLNKYQVQAPSKFDPTKMISRELIVDWADHELRDTHKNMVAAIQDKMRIGNRLDRLREKRIEKELKEMESSSKDGESNNGGGSNNGKDLKEGRGGSSYGLISDHVDGNIKEVVEDDITAEDYLRDPSWREVEKKEKDKKDQQYQSGKGKKEGKKERKKDLYYDHQYQGGKNDHNDHHQYNHSNGKGYFDPNNMMKGGINPTLNMTTGLPGGFDAWGNPIPFPIQQQGGMLQMSGMQPGGMLQMSGMQNNMQQPGGMQNNMQTNDSTTKGASTKVDPTIDYYGSGLKNPGKGGNTPTKGRGKDGKGKARDGKSKDRDDGGDDKKRRRRDPPPLSPLHIPMSPVKPPVKKVFTREEEILNSMVQGVPITGPSSMGIAEGTSKAEDNEKKEYEEIDLGQFDNRQETLQDMLNLEDLKDHLDILENANQHLNNKGDEVDQDEINKYLAGGGDDDYDENPFGGDDIFGDDNPFSANFKANFKKSHDLNTNALNAQWNAVLKEDADQIWNDQSDDDDEEDTQEDTQGDDDEEVDGSNDKKGVEDDAKLGADNPTGKPPPLKVKNSNKNGTKVSKKALRSKKKLEKKKQADLEKLRLAAAAKVDAEKLAKGGQRTLSDVNKEQQIGGASTTKNDVKDADLYDLDGDGVNNEVLNSSSVGMNPFSDDISAFDSAAIAQKNDAKNAAKSGGDHTTTSLKYVNKKKTKTADEINAETDENLKKQRGRVIASSGPGGGGGGGAPLTTGSVVPGGGPLVGGTSANIVNPFHQTGNGGNVNFGKSSVFNNARNEMNNESFYETFSIADAKAALRFIKEAGLISQFTTWRTKGGRPDLRRNNRGGGKGGYGAAGEGPGVTTMSSTGIISSVVVGTTTGTAGNNLTTSGTVGNNPSNNGNLTQGTTMGGMGGVNVPWQPPNPNLPPTTNIGYHGPMPAMPVAGGPPVAGGGNNMGAYVNPNMPPVGGSTGVNMNGMPPPPPAPPAPGAPPTPGAPSTGSSGSNLLSASQIAQMTPQQLMQFQQMNPIQQQQVVHQMNAKGI